MSLAPSCFSSLFNFHHRHEINTFTGWIERDKNQVQRWSIARTIDNPFGRMWLESVLEIWFHEPSASLLPARLHEITIRPRSSENLIAHFYQLHSISRRMLCSAHRHLEHHFGNINFSSSAIDASVWCHTSSLFHVIQIKLPPMMNIHDALCLSCFFFRGAIIYEQSWSRGRLGQLKELRRLWHRRLWRRLVEETNA